MRVDLSRASGRQLHTDILAVAVGKNPSTYTVRALETADADEEARRTCGQKHLFLHIRRFSL